MDRGGRTETVRALTALASEYTEASRMWPDPTRAGMIRAAEQLTFIASGVEAAYLDARTGAVWIEAARRQLDALGIVATGQATP